MLELYAAGIYFAMQTLTTVGYGDIAIIRIDEIIAVILLEFIGVLCFSFASGSLTSVIANTDESNNQNQEKLLVLNRIYTEYKLPHDLYINLRAQLSI
jgi:voltage-gated potassium channel Kch